MAGLNAIPRATVDTRRVPRVDFWLVLAALVLMTVGFMSLYSEGVTRDHGANFRKQILNGVIGLVPFGIFATINPRFWQRAATPIYIVNLLMLVTVLVMGKAAKGAARWIDIGPLQFQPSELAKLLIVLTLATFYASRQDRIQHVSTFLLGLAHAVVPAFLIFRQPHLGAFTVIMVAWFAISLVAHIPVKYLMGVVGAVVILVGGVLAVPSLRAKVLDPYQEGRIQGMSNKGGDRQGKNWQTDRAAIALAVGGVSGTGYGNGQQKAGHFIPEQHNDFIFTVIGEEGGLIGCTLVLTAFGFFFFRIFLIMHLATDLYYRMVAAGIFAVLGFHTFVNIAMVLQLVPVVGLWLPFLSYGGTALWLCMACVGLLINIRRREKPLLF
ncbi:MAG: FtsW/RodA/SpoVE family cell cycle protein [Fimbriimonas sp.]